MRKVLLLQYILFKGRNFHHFHSCSSGILFSFTKEILLSSLSLSPALYYPPTSLTFYPFGYVARLLLIYWFSFEQNLKSHLYLVNSSEFRFELELNAMAVLYQCDEKFFAIFFFFFCLLDALIPIESISLTSWRFTFHSFLPSAVILSLRRLLLLQSTTRISVS